MKDSLIPILQPKSCAERSKMPIQIFHDIEKRQIHRNAGQQFDILAEFEFKSRRKFERDVERDGIGERTGSNRHASRAGRAAGGIGKRSWKNNIACFYITVGDEKSGCKGSINIKFVRYDVVIYAAIDREIAERCFGCVIFDELRKLRAGGVTI